jgi:hypothetical protein
LPRSICSNICVTSFMAAKSLKRLMLRKLQLWELQSLFWKP